MYSRTGSKKKKKTPENLPTDLQAGSSILRLTPASTILFC